MRIRHQIELAMGTVLVLHVFTALMGHHGLERSQHDFDTYESVNADTIRVIEIDKSVNELKKNVATFMLTGHKSTAQRVRELLKDVEGEIGEAVDQTRQQEIREPLGEMLDRVLSYGANFEKVAIDRAARIELVQGEMSTLRDQLITALGADAGDEESWRVVARDHVYQTENAALRYFDAPSRSGVSEAYVNIGAMRDLIDLNATTEYASVLLPLIDGYRDAFHAAVQATRGYMLLVNVVLAGEAAELLYVSTEVRRFSLSQREAIKASMQRRSQRFQLISDAIAAVTVLAGLLTAAIMSRAVLRPILSMTDTLRSLAGGHADAEIAYSHRTDEIGEMAKAAEVFRLKNAETERLLEESQRMSEDLERRNSEMTQFVYTVSHDLRSPLVTIRGFMGVLNDAIASGDTDETRRLMDRISRATGRMSQTLEDLLELSRIGVIVNDLAPIQLGELCEPVLSDLDGAISAAGAEIKVVNPQHAFVADALRMRQVLQNLIQNALVHGLPESGGPVIEIGAKQEGARTILWVRDNGAGIEERHKERIFGIFQQLNRESTGTGVGLAIVRKIAEAHEGVAWVDSTPGAGARFCLSIPELMVSEPVLGSAA